MAGTGINFHYSVMFPEKPPLVHFGMPLRCRYSETDKMGVVYHSRYLEYFETVRTEFVREMGVPYADMEDTGVMLPVADVRLSFRRPVRYDELMDARLYIYDMPVVRLYTYYAIHTEESNSPAVTGEVVLVFVDAHTRKPVRAPRLFLEKLSDYAQLAR